MMGYWNKNQDKFNTELQTSKNELHAVTVGHVNPQ